MPHQKIDFTSTGPQDTLQERLERAFIAGRLTRRGFMGAMTAAGLATAGLPAMADELESIRKNQAERAAQLLPAYEGSPRFQCNK